MELVVIRLADSLIGVCCHVRPSRTTDGALRLVLIIFPTSMHTNVRLLHDVNIDTLRKVNIVWHKHTPFQTRLLSCLD